MLDRHDHHELLALIEGELDATQAALLRRRLADEPRGAAVLALVDRIRQDRVALRSLPEPELPQEVVAQLETLLARPMLMEPLESTEPARIAKPGEFRRQYHRRTRRINWMRLAIAATLFVALIAGVWAAVNGLVLPLFNATDNGAIARNDSTTDSVDVGNAASLTNENLPLTGTVHHYLPSAVPLDGTQPRLAVVPAKSPVGGMIVADFAIVVQTSDQAGTERQLQTAASHVDPQIALVRNFSFAEAQRLEEEWRLAQGGKSDRSGNPIAAASGQPSNHSSAATEMKSLAERVRQRLNSGKDRMTVNPAKSVETSGQLAGPKEHAPTLEQQLDFSSRGATHTLTVSASEMKSLLEQMSLGNGQNTALRMMPQRDVATQSTGQAGAWQPLSLWMTESPRVRSEFERLAALPPDTIVFVPVIVQSVK